jgi:small-conductance mechanosensitive channel
MLQMASVAVLLGILLASFGSSGSRAQDQAVEPASLESAKTALDEVEAAIGRDDITSDTLASLRPKLNSAADAIQAKIDELEPRFRDLEERRNQLGPAPAKDAPPEAPEVAKDRQELAADHAEVGGALKQAQVLKIRANQLSEQLADKRHTLYARELFARSGSVLDPSLWMEASTGLAREWRSAQALFEAWTTFALQGHHLRLVTAGIILIGIVVLAIGVTRWWLPRFDAGLRDESRFAKAWTALWVFVWLAARTPLALMAGLFVLDLLGLLISRLDQIGQGLVAGVAAAAFGRAVARALFAPDRPERRLVQVEDQTARSLHNHLVWASRALGVAILLQIAHKTLYAPLTVTVATNALFAAVTAAFLSHLVLRLGSLKSRHDGGAGAVPGLHPLAWLMTIIIIVALIAGYTAFAAFVALRVIVAAAVFGALYLLLIVTQALFAALSEQTPRGRALAANLGLSPRSVGIAGALLSAVIRLMLIVLACLLIIGPWEVSTADLFDSVRNVPFGFKIGEIQVSFRAILGALVGLAVLLAITRVVQRWLELELLPRTSLEPSLQLSIATIFGYIGGIAAIALALAGLGIDLQKIALVAGALSVGIGFGLQSIVSNFVSGLILLTERPIRVGDSIIVKGEEGWVRRVRVRATEIETFDRATVIIPNSELITGVVKNWTHANTLGRIVIKVGVAYDSDPDQVRDVLVEVAKAHPQIVQAPSPSALLIAFGASTLDFELRCIVTNVESGSSVRSDLHFAIIKRFREVGIRIPYPKTEAQGRADPVGQSDLPVPKQAPSRGAA